MIYAKWEENGVAKFGSGCAGLGWDGDRNSRQLQGAQIVVVILKQADQGSLHPAPCRARIAKRTSERRKDGDR